MEWYWIVLIVLGSLTLWFILSALLYRQFFKRFYDIVLSGIALIILSPLLLFTAIFVRIKLGAPIFYSANRVGKNNKVFKLVKFRSMSNEKDNNGNLLPDTKRLTRFGRFLRSTSIDELPELFNIFKGEMSIIGPRPLPEIYLPYYTEEELERHTVRPGLTGLAQVNGRNSISWDAKFKFDVEYVRRISIFKDIAIIFKTIKKVLIKEGIGQGEEHPGSLNEIREKRRDF